MGTQEGTERLDNQCMDTCLKLLTSMSTIVSIVNKTTRAMLS